VDETGPQALAQQVMANPKYKTIVNSLVLRLSHEAISNGLTGKAAVKVVRNKLHQVGGAYFKQKIDYAAEQAQLAQLPMDPHSDQVAAFCQKTMRSHASTAERLPILAEFFQTCLAPIAPVTSVLDLACGLNPLAIPWMPLSGSAQYFACDIYLDMLALIESFFIHVNLDGKTSACDLVSAIPIQEVQVAFLLKSIPCLEQMDKRIGIRLLEGIQAEHILVSFPVHSLGGKNKGMQDFYGEHFTAMIKEESWRVREFHFKTELAFLVSK
jgi:16S rRNA (guanine(1405)-N(7))-methyltransferase